MRVVNRRYVLLWHNHEERLYMNITTGKVLCGFLIPPKGLIPFVIRPNLIFLGSLEKSSSWLRLKCFHSLAIINRMSDLSIPLSFDMPKQELSFPSVREHMLQAVNDT
jgi:hypothetical protein